MLKSVATNIVNNIEPSFTNNSEGKFKLRSWFETVSLQSNCTSSNRLYRKRFYPSTFENELLSTQASERVWKRRREYLNKQGNFTSKKPKNRRQLKSDFYRKSREFGRMTRTSCCHNREQNESRYFDNRLEHSNSVYQRNRSLSQSNGTCLPRHQLSDIDDSSNLLRNATYDRRYLNPNVLHHISTHSSQTIPAKEVFATSNNINSHRNVQSSNLAQSASQCHSINQFPLTSGISPAFRQSQQTRICSQPNRRGHNTSALSPSFQTGVPVSTQYLQSRPVNINTLHSSISVSSIPNRTLSSTTSSFPIITRSLSQNANQLRLTAYPINSYPPQHQTLFSCTSIPTTAIFPQNSAFCSTVQMPALIGDASSCQHCAIMASAGLNTLSNLSSMFQFPVAPSVSSLVTLAAVSADRLSYVPVHRINNWQSQNPYLPAAWSYNDLSSILHHSTARHIVQDNLTQRLLSTSPNSGIQLFMMSPSSVVGSSDALQIRPHIIPVSLADSMSPISISRYMPIIDHLPLNDQQKLGISKHELDQIPIRKFVKIDVPILVTEDSKDRCMICLEDFIPDEIIRILKCSHEFHSSCVERWLKINRTCPLCRSDAAGPCRRNS